MDVVPKYILTKTLPQSPVCDPEGRECYLTKMRPQSIPGCSVACFGLHADIFYINSSATHNGANMDKLGKIQEEYDKYKRSITENLVYDPTIMESIKIRNVSFLSLQVVQIFFDTPTYDKIEKDQKVTLEAQLGVIGGTMGLLTGFSILSGVEIIYFAVKLFVRIIENRKD